MDEQQATAALALQRCVADRDLPQDLERFLDVVYECGLHADASNADEFLRETAPLVERALMPLGTYINDLERYVSQEFYGDEWFRASERRSRLEFVRDLYRGLIDPGWDTVVDVENVDHLLQTRGDNEGPVDPSRIPAGMPHSHWWWWYPKQPPQ